MTDILILRNIQQVLQEICATALAVEQSVCTAISLYFLTQGFGYRQSDTSYKPVLISVDNGL